MSKADKYLKKDNLLSLVCEWDECNKEFNQMDPFMHHVTEHLKVFLPSVSEIQAGESVSNDCCWTDCCHEIENIFEFIRHVYFHCFHCKLKCLGKAMVERTELTKCSLEATSRNIIPELPQQLMCGWKHCNRVFENPFYFYNHVGDHVDSEYSTHKPENGCLCLWDACTIKTKNRTRLRDHLRSHTQEKLIACPTCGSLFSNNSKFNDHLVRQTEGDVQSFECTHCNKRFATERILKDHIRQHVAHFRCPYCQMACLTQTAWQTHINYKHTDIKNYHCDNCDYSAKSSNDLKKHMESHEERFFECNVTGCEYTARHFYSLQRHYKTMHQDGDGKLFQCHICEKRFTRGEKLTKHLQKEHKMKWPAGNYRFRYKMCDDGFYRLQTVRYESVHLSQPTKTLPNSVAMTTHTDASQIEAPKGDVDMATGLVSMTTVNNVPANENPANISEFSPVKIEQTTTRKTSRNTRKRKTDTSEVDQSKNKKSRRKKSNIQEDIIVEEPDYSYNLDLLGDVALNTAEPTAGTSYSNIHPLLTYSPEKSGKTKMCSTGDDNVTELQPYAAL